MTRYYRLTNSSLLEVCYLSLNLRFGDTGRVLDLVKSFVFNEVTVVEIPFSEYFPINNRYFYSFRIGSVAINVGSPFPISLSRFFVRKFMHHYVGTEIYNPALDDVSASAFQALL